jgi:hypothetical protein
MHLLNFVRRFYKDFGLCLTIACRTVEHFGRIIASVLSAWQPY